MESQKMQQKSIYESPWFWAGATALLYLVIRLVSGFDGLYGQDSYAYLDQARKIQAWMQDGSPTGQFFWTRNYPLLGALWPFGGLQYWMQFLSIVGISLSVASIIGCTQNNGKRSVWLGPIVMILLGLSPFFLRNALSIMSDSLSIGLLMGGIWAGDSAWKRKRMSGVLLGAFLLGAAVWMRNPLLLLAFPIFSYWVFRCIKAKQFLPILGMLALFFVTALPELLILPSKGGNAYLASVKHSYLQDWSFLNFFKREFIDTEGHQRYKLPNLLALTGAIWHLGYWGIGVLGIGLHALGRKVITTKVSWTLIAGVVLYVLLLAGIPFQNNRFLLPLLPFVALWLVGGWIWLMEKVQRKFAILLITAFFLTNLLFAGYINLKIVTRSQMEVEIATELPLRITSDETLFEFGMGIMLDAREVAVQHHTMYDSLQIAPKKGDWVLFNLKMNREVWKGKWPMRNWESINAEFEAQISQEWEGGWTLYELQ